ELLGAAGRLATWPLPEGGGFALLAPGWERVYRQGRQRLEQAYRQASDEAFHEWRKRIKDHWYHTKLLQPVWVDEMQVRRSALKALSDRVGDDHDLAVLRAALAAEPELFGAAATRRSIDAMATERQQALRGQARGLGLCLYAERPAPHVKRLQAYWKAWRG
ncbi:MAG TPA: CHAD domain-containing protein, partial [Pseudohaliea sp.]|nr:CHAD domain-containing protein [Pseudohaliea sp.]